MSKALFLACFLGTFGLTTVESLAHCSAGLAPHRGCLSPPPKHSGGTIPTWRPKESDFASDKERSEAMASYRAEIEAARVEGHMSTAAYGRAMDGYRLNAKNLNVKLSPNLQSPNLQQHP